MRDLYSTPLPMVPYHLLPWLFKQRTEVVEGAYRKDEKGKEIHDGTGLDKAEKDLRQAQSILDKDKSEGAIREALTIQRDRAQNYVDYYRWRLDLLERIIEATKTHRP